MTNGRSLPHAGAGRSLLPALALLPLLALAGCAGGASAEATPVATTTVDLPTSYKFAPTAITVEVGQTVTWTNHDNFTHNVALPDAEPLTMSPGESASYTFETPGLVEYVCSLHPKDMRASVLVTEAGA
jgi:plastocyanin